MTSPWDANPKSSDKWQVTSGKKSALLVTRHLPLVTCHWAKSFGLFVGFAVVLGWVMYLAAR